jgi:hypothetical protein
MQTPQVRNSIKKESIDTLPQVEPQVTEKKKQKISWTKKIFGSD